MVREPALTLRLARPARPGRADRCSPRRDRRRSRGRRRSAPRPATATRAPHPRRTQPSAHSQASRRSHNRTRTAAPAPAGRGRASSPARCSKIDSRRISTSPSRSTLTSPVLTSYATVVPSGPPSSPMNEKRTPSPTLLLSSQNAFSLSPYKLTKASSGSTSSSSRFTASRREGPTGCPSRAAASCFSPCGVQRCRVRRPWRKTQPAGGAPRRPFPYAPGAPLEIAR